MNYIETLSAHPDNKDPKRQQAIVHAGLILVHEGVEFPQHPTVVINPSEHPRFSLDSEWYRQAEQNAYLYAGELSISRWQYMDGLPKFPVQPKETLNIPVIVQTPHGKLTLARMARILEVDHDEAVVKEFQDWIEDPGGFSTFKNPNPYSTYMDDGSNNLDTKPVVVREKLAEDERGGNVFDGLALARIVYPGVLRHHYLDLPGSQFGSDGAPLLDVWGGQPGLGGSFIDLAIPGYGSVVAGRNVEFGNLFS